jgi:hypothetical protein
MSITFSYNRVTFEKTYMELFEVAEPTVLVAILVVEFVCNPDIGPKLAGMGSR